MNDPFALLVKTVVDNHGAAVFDNRSRCKSLLDDYARGEFKKEIRLFTQIVDTGYAAKLRDSKEPDIIRLQLIRHLQDDYFIAPETARNMSDILLWILHHIEPEQAGWRPVRAANEIAGVWEGFAPCTKPASNGIPAAVLPVAITLIYRRNAEQITITATVDYSPLLDTMIAQKVQAEGITVGKATKVLFWQNFIASAADEGTAYPEKYTGVSQFIFAPQEAAGFFISEDETRIRLIISQGFFNNGADDAFVLARNE
jgi:hypothetical protein